MKHFVLTLLCLALLSTFSVLFASESRMEALGGMYGYVPDNTDVFVYPSLLMKYNKTVSMEMRNSISKSDWSVGTNVPLFNGVLGVYFNEPTNINIDGTLNSFHSDYTAGDLTIDKKMQLLFALKSGWGFGLGLSSDAKSFSASAVHPKKLVNESAMLIELIGAKTFGKMDIAANITLPIATVENEETKEKTDYSNFNLMINARRILKETNKITYVALGDIGFGGGTLEHKTSGTDKYESGSFVLDLGVGVNYQVAANTMIGMSIKPLGINVASQKYPTSPGANTNYEKATVVIVSPEFRMGLETQLLKWLTARVGASQIYYSEGTALKPPTGDEFTSGESSSTFNAELGTTMVWKAFTLDAVINHKLLFDGPNVVGGTAPGIASMLSLGWHF